MKGFPLLAAIAAVTACMENPGTDGDLEMKHNRLEAVFDLATDHPVVVRLERIGGVTRMFLANRGPAVIDSLAFFAQAARFAPYAEDLQFYAPIFTDLPLFELYASIGRLEQGTERELAVLNQALPSHLDELALSFIPLRGSLRGSVLGHPLSGYYEGSYASQVGTFRDAGTTRGLIGSEGHFFFWMRETAGSVASLQGEVRGDTVRSATYDRSSIRYDADAGDPAARFRSVDGLDSLVIRDSRRPQDTLAVALRLRAPIRLPDPPGQ